MKKLWNSNLSSTLSTLGTTAVSGLSAGATQLQQRLAAPAVPPTSSQEAQPPTPAPAAAASAAASPASDKQYLRLPLESARKLRWFDKGDLAAVVRTHSREKRELQDTISALKKLLIKAGYTDSTLDEETRQLLIAANQLKESDEGVESTLVVAAYAEMETLNERVVDLEAQLGQLRTKLMQANRKANYSIMDEDDATSPMTSPAATAPLPALVAGPSNEELAEPVKKLLACLAELDAADSSVAALGQQVKQQELEVQKLAVEATLLASIPAAGRLAADDDGTSTPSQGGQDVEAVRQLVARVQQLELQRMSAMDELMAAQQQAALVPEAQKMQDSLREQLAEANEQVARQLAVNEQLQGDLAAAAEKLRVVEERAAEMKGKAASADLISKYQDACVEAEERAAVAERRAMLVEARVGKLEAAVKEAQAEARTARQQQKEAEGKLVSAAAAASGAAKAKQEETEAGRQATEAVRQLEGDKAALQEQVGALQAEVRALKEQAAKGEARLQQAEAREGRLMAEVREAELLAGERDDLAAQVVALREHLEGSRQERGQLQHYKQMAQELHEGRSRMEGELVTTAQIVTTLEARLREAHSQAEGARMAAEVAEGRAKAAEAGVVQEVASRLESAGANRRLWPTAIKEEVGRLEARVEAVQGALAVLQGEMDRECKARQAEAQQRLEAQRQAMELEDRLRSVESSSRERLQHLEAALELSQQDAEAARSVILKLEQEMDELMQHQHHQAQIAATLRPVSRTSSSALAPPSPLRVGGGSLYGISDLDGPPTPSAASPSATNGHHHHHRRTPSFASSPGAVAREKLAGIDVVYLKNVLMKFIEAVVLGKGPERDALLPAVATILQASPGEYRLLRQLTQNTTGTAGLLNALGGYLGSGK